MTSWADGFEDYVAHSYEVRLHRRRDTFRGVLWPPTSRNFEIALAAYDKVSANAQ